MPNGLEVAAPASSRGTVTEIEGLDLRLRHRCDCDDLLASPPEIYHSVAFAHRRPGPRLASSRLTPSLWIKAPLWSLSRVSSGLSLKPPSRLTKRLRSCWPGLYGNQRKRRCVKRWRRDFWLWSVIWGYCYGWAWGGGSLAGPVRAGGMAGRRPGGVPGAGAVRVPFTRVFSLYVVQAGSARPRGAGGPAPTACNRAGEKAGWPGAAAQGCRRGGPQRWGGLAAPARGDGSGGPVAGMGASCWSGGLHGGAGGA